MQSLDRKNTGIAKQNFYADLCAQLQALLGSEGDFLANSANTAALLFHALPGVNWVGFYFARKEELILGPFQGKPACTRIPFGKGVCGKAATTLETVVVPDTHEFPGHIACDPESRSEIVIPLLNWGKLYGVLDLDSPELNRFDEDDCEGLESVAAVFLAGQITDSLPDFSEESLVF